MSVGQVKACPEMGTCSLLSGCLLFQPGDQCDLSGVTHSLSAFRVMLGGEGPGEGRGDGKWNFIGQTAFLHFNLKGGGGSWLRIGPLQRRPVASCR